MRILFLANAASIHTVRWVNALSDVGHEVHLIYKADDQPKLHVISDKVLLHRLKFGGTTGYFLNSIELRNITKKINPDVINAHYASGYGTLARLAHVKPLVLSVWGADVYDFPYQSKLKMKIVLDNLKYADIIASTSSSMGKQVEKLLNGYSKEIEITPFGVDVNKFKRIKHEKNNGSINIGLIKTLSPKYGIDDFINAIKILKDTLEINGDTETSNNIRAIIYGDGVQKKELQNLIIQLGLDATIKLSGSIPNSEVPKALNEFDIFCATSILDSESFGVAVVEAMSMELPVVASDVSGFKEVIQNRETGIIVERKNPEKIAEALRQLVLDIHLREQFGIRGRKRVIKLYSWDDNVEMMISIYKKIKKINH